MGIEKQGILLHAARVEAKYPVFLIQGKLRPMNQAQCFLPFKTGRLPINPVNTDLNVI